MQPVDSGAEDNSIHYKQIYSKGAFEWNIILVREWKTGLLKLNKDLKLSTREIKSSKILEYLLLISKQCPKRE